MNLFGIKSARADWITDAPSLAEVLNNVLMYVLSIAGLLAILAIVFSGVMYILSGGNTEKVQKAKAGLMYSITGLVVVLISYSIVRTVSDTLGQ